MTVRNGARWIGYFGVTLAALIGLGALSFTVLELVDAGWSGVTEFGLMGFVFAWPTILGMIGMLAGPSLARRLGRSLGSGTAALCSWVLSLALYSAFGPDPIRFISSVAIWSGTPIVTVYVTQWALERTRLRPRLKVGLVTVVAVVMVWATAPVALVVACAMGAGCP